MTKARKAKFGRKHFVFNPDVIDEQKTIASALREVTEGEPKVEIHKHSHGYRCDSEPVHITDTKDIGRLMPNECYYFDKETHAP